jgi:hypothetical protein
MEPNLGLFLQMEAYTVMKFWTGESGDISGPDLPMDKYSGRISYNEENKGRESGLIFLRNVKRGAGGIDLF